MIRALVDRLPAMITPRWVSTKTQPIAIEDVIAYLVAAAELPRLEELADGPEELRDRLETVAGLRGA